MITHWVCASCCDNHTVARIVYSICPAVGRGGQGARDRQVTRASEVTGAAGKGLQAGRQATGDR